MFKLPNPITLLLSYFVIGRCKQAFSYGNQGKFYPAFVFKMGLVTLQGCFKEPWFSLERQKPDMLLGRGCRDRQGSRALGYCVPLGRSCDCAWSPRVPSAACSPGTALHVNTLLSKTLNADFRTAAGACSCLSCFLFVCCYKTEQMGPRDVGRPPNQSETHPELAPCPKV